MSVDQLHAVIALANKYECFNPATNPRPPVAVLQTELEKLECEYRLMRVDELALLASQIMSRALDLKRQREWTIHFIGRMEEEDEARVWSAKRNKLMGRPDG